MHQATRAGNVEIAKAILPIDICSHRRRLGGELRRYNVERAFSFKAGKASFFDNWLKERRLANMPPRACVVKRRARRHVHKSPPQMQKALLSGTM